MVSKILNLSVQELGWSDNESVATSLEDQTQQQTDNLEEELQYDDGEEEAEPPRSTKRPLPKKKKQENKSKEDCLLDQAASVLWSRQNKVVDSEEVFGQNVAHSLRAIPDKRAREYAKVKIQEILFQAQFGMLGLPQNQQYNVVPPKESFMGQLYQGNTSKSNLSSPQNNNYNFST